MGGGYTPTPIGQQGQGYFSPQMLQDPWEELRRDKGGWGEGHKGDNQGKRKSGEMLQEDENSSEDVTKKAAKPLAPFYRTGGDGEQERKAWERAKMLADEEEDFDEVLDGENMGDSMVGDAGLSDSLIPQVGDSFCERSQLIDSEKTDSQELVEEEKFEENQS